MNVLRQWLWQIPTFSLNMLTDLPKTCDSKKSIQLTKMSLTDSRLYLLSCHQVRNPSETKQIPPKSSAQTHLMTIFG